MLKKFFASIAIAFLVCLGVEVETSVPAQAYTAEQCVAAHSNPQGTVATWCHQNGWTVNSYIVVNPYYYVRWYDGRYMRTCGSENGGPNYPCWWNFDDTSGSQGQKFWYDIGGHIHYVNGLIL